MKRLIFLLFLCGCHTVQYSEQPGWCFIRFHDRQSFFNYMAAHEKYATNGGNINSMQLLGCAYYQKGDLASAEKWLKEAHTQGDEGAATALTAIYLKEEQPDLASTWKGHITTETDRVRWLYVIGHLERYRQTNATFALNLAHQALANKIHYEGSTEMTTQLLNFIKDLVKAENECNNTNSECSLVTFNEKKNYMHIFSRGALAEMIPSVPISWNYEPNEIGVLPEENTISPTLSLAPFSFFKTTGH